MPASEGDAAATYLTTTPPEPGETAEWVEQFYREPTGDDAFDAHVDRVRWWYAWQSIYRASCRQLRRRHVATV
jgi:hypothetical protein